MKETNCTVGKYAAEAAKSKLEKETEKEVDKDE